MRKFPAKTISRVRQWELFAATFFNYMFATDEGRRVRGRFVRDVLRRTFFYCLAGIPPYVALDLLHWISLTDVGSTVGYAILLFNCALGVAILRSIRDYRARIELYYASQFAGDQEADDDLPVGHREIPAGPRRILQPQPPDADPSDSSTPTLQLDAPAERPIPHEGRVALRCTNCLRTCTLTADAARRMTRCQYCGGDLVQV